ARRDPDRACHHPRVPRRRYDRVHSLPEMARAAPITRDSKLVMETLHAVAHWLALALEVIAIGIIGFGAAEALVGIARGADLVNTSFDPTWDELGRLAVVAVVRTFLSFFLDREVEDTRRRQHGAT